MGDGGPGPLAVLSNVPGPAVVAAPAKKIGPVRLSTGVSAGLLLTPIQPVYPAIAKAARAEGTVVMEAVISKTGRIESLRAVSGPAMLRGAALDAVQAARYQPYKLNGEPTEVQTTITVNFRLGS
jgi:protein TonB